MSKNLSRHLTLFALSGCVALGYLGNIGCQTTRNDQTLPSPHYLTDDIRHYPAGPEFTLSREAAQMDRDAAERMRASHQEY